MTDTYRSAASVLVLRPKDNGADYQLLLLHKPRKNDSWQLPQGGVEGNETVIQAAMRELQEEAGLTECQLIGKSDKVYCYDFPDSYRRFRPDNICGQRIEYVFAFAKQDAAIHVDENEINGYLWIDISELDSYVERDAYRELVKDLFDEAVAALARRTID